MAGLRQGHAQLRLTAVRTESGALVLDDTYNASPESTLAALNLLAQQGDTARVVALATRYLDDPDAIFAAAAVRLLARAGGARSRALLLERFGKETRTRVRSAIEGVLRP